MTSDDIRSIRSCYSTNMNFPRLGYLGSLPGQYPAYDFSNAVLVAIQHLLGTNGSLFELLHRLGLPYEQMCLLGKVYSTNETVYGELKRRGVYVHPSSLSLEVAQLVTDYKLNLADAADELLTKAIPKLKHLQTPRTLLIVDDGGVLVHLVNDRVREINARIVGVEQTRSGTETLRTIRELKFPVVNVAESKTKLHDESQYIATSIIKHTTARLARMPNRKSLRESNVLVVGHGAIGGNVALQLRPIVKSVEVHDIVELADIAVVRDFKRAVEGKDIVFGCVGKAWLPADCHSLLTNGVVLVSGSSSNSEFLGVTIDPDSYIESALPFQNSDLARAHSDYSFNNGSGWVLNAGFPVNFDGSIEPTGRSIELTRMLMLSGILQTLTAEANPGLRELNVKFQPPKISRISSTPKL